MPEILHSQQGLTIQRNDNNKFVVIRLHYTADPVKATEIWQAEAKAGFPESRWNREYEIQWDALDGQKVFPEIVQFRQQIVIPSESIEFPDSQVYWAGYDHGMRNPSAFIVYTIDNDGTIYAVWEHYKPCVNVIQFIDELKQCPYWKKIKYIAADPSLKQMRAYSLNGNPVSSYEMFLNQGVRNIIWGSQDETAWMMLMRKYWADKEDIQFKIMDRCQNLIREFEKAIYPNMSEMLLATHNFRENMVDKDNHALDATKYFMLSRAKLQQRSFNYTTMVNKWRH